MRNVQTLYRHRFSPALSVILALILLAGAILPTAANAESRGLWHGPVIDSAFNAAMEDVMRQNDFMLKFVVNEDDNSMYGIYTEADVPTRGVILYGWCGEDRQICTKTEESLQTIQGPVYDCISYFGLVTDADPDFEVALRMNTIPIGLILCVLEDDPNIDGAELYARLNLAVALDEENGIFEYVGPDFTYKYSFNEVTEGIYMIGFQAFSHDPIDPAAVLATLK